MTIHALLGFAPQKGMLGYYKMPACLCHTFSQDFLLISIYIFLSFWKSHSMDLIRNLFLSHCLQKCFLVTSLISTLTASILISFLDLNVSISLLYGFFAPFSLYIKINLLFLRKYSVNKFKVFC